MAGTFCGSGGDAEKAGDARVRAAPGPVMSSPVQSSSVQVQSYPAPDLERAELGLDSGWTQGAIGRIVSAIGWILGAIGCTLGAIG